MKSNIENIPEFEVMIYEKIQNLLEQNMGLDPESIGASTIKRSIDKCFEVSACKDIREYYDQLIVSHELMSKLIEAVVIPETWFFRNTRPFDLLEDYIKNSWYLNNLNKDLHILSIPCSTGEEPYTIAMVLSELMLPISEVKIDAVDISEEALGRAREAVYGNNSFRGENIGFREKYFTQSGEKYQLNEAIRSEVSFSHGNLLEDKLLPPSGGYDFIFCRNLLIYFDRETQEKAVTILHKLLAREGVLFIGHAEGSYIFEGRFELLNARGAFAYKKIEPGQYKKNTQVGLSRVKNVQSVVGEKKSTPLLINNKIKKSDIFSDATKVQDGKRVEKNRPDKLLMAKQLADDGEIEKSIKVCEEYLLEDGGDIDANYLLAVLYEAGGYKEKSIALFRKIIYLDPDHYEALTYLALQAERDGDKNSVIALKRRAQRAEERSKN